MALQRTFSIIKPDATERNLTGAVNAVIEAAGLRIVAQKRIQMTRGQAETFYAVHKERPFFGELVDFMVSGPVVVQVLEGDNAIAKYREVMGARTRRMPRRVRSASCSPSPWARTRCTGRTHRKRPRSKSPSSSQAMKSPAEFAHRLRLRRAVLGPPFSVVSLDTPGNALHDGNHRRDLK